MNAKLPIVGILLVSLVLPAVARPRKHRGKPPASTREEKKQELPSVQLARFTAAYLEPILSPIDHQVPLPRTRLSQLRASFAHKWAQAPERDKAQYQTAVAVCDALESAMDEREKAFASLQASAAVHAPSDVGAHRKDMPTQRSQADARLADVNLQREAHEEQSRKEEATQNDELLTTTLKTNWTQRAFELRQIINLLLTRERAAEHTPQPGAAAGSTGPAGNTITLDKTVQVKVKYGTATIQAGTTLPVVSSDAKGVVVQYMGENVTLPK